MNVAAGIHGPSEVEVGTPSFEVDAGSGARTLEVYVPGSGVEPYPVTVGEDGKAIIPVPPNARAHQTLVVRDPADPDVSIEVRIVPSTDR